MFHWICIGGPVLTLLRVLVLPSILGISLGAGVLLCHFGWHSGCTPASYWRLLCCRAHSDSPVVWVNCVGTFEATRWLSWYGVGLANADRLPVVVRIPAVPLGSRKCDPPKGNRRRPQKNCVGTFGVSSGSYWWTRLFPLVGRLVTSVLRQAPNLQIVYVPADFGLGAWQISLVVDDNYHL